MKGARQIIMNQGKILHVCISPRKGTVKSPVPRAELQENYGLRDDAHAGPWHRQVSLLDDADIETMRAKGLALQPGAFGENLVTGGLDLGQLGIGTRLRVDQAELEITQIGKVCHSRCAIYFRTGDCIMPRDGIFARVLGGGGVGPGSEIEVVELVPRDVIQAGVLTVSDRCAAGTMEDGSGPAVAEMLAGRLGARVAWTGLLADDREAICETLKDVAGRSIDLLITVGGTGLGPRDVTPEATLAVITREAPGLVEAMRAASIRITPHALLQRGVCGVCGSTLIVNLPGSRAGAVENLNVILPALPHAVQLLRGHTDHPGDERRCDTQCPPEGGCRD